LKERLQNMASL